MDEKELIDSLDLKPYIKVVGTSEHDFLKRLGRKILKDMGFTSGEITEEYGILIKNTEYKVDVCGISPRLGKKIAIECGSCQAGKMTILSIYFDEIILLPYDTFSTLIELEDLMKDNESKEEQIMNLKSIIKERELKIDENSYKTTELELINIFAKCKELGALIKHVQNKEINNDRLKNNIPTIIFNDNSDIYIFLENCLNIQGKRDRILQPTRVQS